MSTAPAATVVAHVRDLLFSSRIAETCRRLGCRCRPTRSLEDLRAALAERPAVVMLDLSAAGDDAAEALSAIEGAGRPAPVLAWTTHVAWRATAPLHPRCDRVVTREQLTAELPELLRGYLEAPGRVAGQPASDAGSAAP